MQSVAGMPCHEGRACVWNDLHCGREAYYVQLLGPGTRRRYGIIGRWADGGKVRCFGQRMLSTQITTGLHIT
jgi:hypothetical protein